MEYTNENRGKIQYPERKRQIMDFDGLKFGKITPSDIDAFIEYKDKGFIFIEIKLHRKDGQFKVPPGQKLGYKRLVDALTAAGKPAILIYAEHFEYDPSMNIDASVCTVDSVYGNHEYRYSVKGKTVKEVVDKYINWIDNNFF